MSSPSPKPWPSAPFGRIGAMLGFTWIMPIGTIPLPFHPWLARLLPWGILALIGHRVVVAAMGEGGGVSWWGLLLAAAILAVPMAIPILSWVALAFRVPLLQALLIGGAMLLLAVDAATGVAPPWAAMLPAAWLALFFAQRFGGPIYLRRLEAANAAFPMIAPGTRLVIAEADTVSASRGHWLIRHKAVARVAIDPDLTGRSTKLDERTYHRLRPANLPAVQALVQRLKPKGWSVSGDIVAAPGIADPGVAPPIRVRMVRHRAPLWLVAGRREALEVDDGGETRRLIGGEAALIGKWPIFSCFYWLSIFGGRSQWVAGFAREKPVVLGSTRFYDLAERLFAPVEEGPPYADATPLLAALAAIDAETRAAAEAMLAALLRLDPDLPMATSLFAKHPELLDGQGEALCDCLAAAKTARYEAGVRLSAQLLAELPDDAFRALGKRLLILLNSKELAFRLLGGEDPAIIDLPEKERREHVIGGFSLVKHVPALYQRLGELGEAARPLIMGLGETGRWPAPLVKAREMLDDAR